MARVLVVDDQKISRLTLAGILEEAGHAVRAEESGPAGIAVAREWLPDVVVLDVHMPGMDGFEVVAHLKEDPVTESMPVVFLTGEPPTDDLVVRGLALGAHDFLSKGCSKAELLARVGVMERIKRGHDELSAIARISDALLRSVDPDELARQFLREALRVFRAQGMALTVDRHGTERLRIAEGLDGSDDAALAAVFGELGAAFHSDSAADARVLSPEQISRLLPHLPGPPFASAGAARVRRGPSTVMVLVLAREPALYRPDVDGPLLRNLTSQASIAIEHALLNRRARVQARDLEQAIHERSRFFASLSHELRTPINAVIGYNHLLRDEIFGPLNEAQARAVDKANRSAQHLLELVDDILDISKIEAGKLEIFPERVDLADLLRDTATTLQLQAQDKGIELAVRTPDFFLVTTDPARLRQIVLNLLSNAVKFTEEGSVEVVVEDGHPERVTVRVSDTGRGIPLEDRERIFSEFEQGGTSATQPGTGLGLAIARRLAGLLGGTLRVESEVGVGSTFILELPRHARLAASELSSSGA
jgi:signal transduction histidine kinase/ActR/RegA family two-component response regulator